MSINSQRELEEAVREFQRLSEAPAESADARRRRELDADIKAYYAECSNDLRVGKPPSSP